MAEVRKYNIATYDYEKQCVCDIIVKAYDVADALATWEFKRQRMRIRATWGEYGNTTPRYSEATDIQPVSISSPA